MTDRELRDEFERVQAENRGLRARNAELEHLEGEVAQLLRKNAQLRLRLERADEIREQWDRQKRLLKQELAIALGEQKRLRKLLENARDEARMTR
jgi:hypothetical protein